MKKILGLDLGTNSIGWALINSDSENNNNKILGMGSRIIPMSQDILSDFTQGNSISQTAERTQYRSTRRLRERHLLRRERLHRVLHLMGLLPKHYDEMIDFENHPGKFLPETEPKIAWSKNDEGKYEFIFKKSFEEMMADFKANQPELLTDGKKVPYDWTIYYLRKKALTQKIEKEELAWILLNFNQKRGYYQLRGEEEDEENPNKSIEYHALKVTHVEADEAEKNKSDIWYTIYLENGWIYRRSSKIPLFDWIGVTKEFIVTTELNDDGTVKIDKEGKEKRSFRIPSEDDWTLLKKKTETDIDKSKKTVGTYIYDTLLKKPDQKIRGKLIRTIERKYYKKELKKILTKQKEFHPELKDRNLYRSCVVELYPNNKAQQNNIRNKDFTYLFIEDIIFYQRPLKSKKSLISNCKFEYRTYKDKEGNIRKAPLKCVPKSHPLYQEFRLWKFVQDLRIYEREKKINGKLYIDYDVTNEFIKTEEDLVNLFDWLNKRSGIKQNTLLSSYFKVKKTNKTDKQLPYRWNYVEDKEYPCNETRFSITNRLEKINDLPNNFLTNRKEFELWHLLYSVIDKNELEKALKKFAAKNNLPISEFVDAFVKFPPFERDYGSYSEKALKKLLPLMRMGKYWNYEAIDLNTRQRIEKLLTGEIDETIHDKVREKTSHLTDEKQFKGLPEWLAAYVVYGRHSEMSEYTKWNTYHDLNNYLQDFKQHSLRNPIVEQVIMETLRVVRDCWEKYGNIDEIHVELGREIKNPAEKRKKITKTITQNENTNLRIKALLIELANDGVENARPYSPTQEEILKIYEEGVLNSTIDIPNDIEKIVRKATPTKQELNRYKLWLEQKYRSPYTGEIIPLAKLFTPAYEIEHIIPQSLYFDDSLSNKVICESEVNKLKGNQLAYEFIKTHHGEKVELNFGKTVEIMSKEAYEKFVNENYRNNFFKRKKLLMDDIPDEFIERQINDTRYITKVVKSLLSNIVREEDEQEPTSKNVIVTTGQITNTLKRDWGLNDIWNEIIYPRFERLNELTNSILFGQWVNENGKRFFRTQVPLDLQKGFSKKRIDHRHHAMDALVIACTTRNHVNYLNNESAKSSNRETRYDLRNKLCKKVKTDDKGNYIWQFIKPWETFTQDAKIELENIVVSFKQNLRVINKTTNYYQRYVNGKKVIDKQTKGDHWAIRKSLHKDTVAGQVNLRFKKKVSLSVAIDQPENIVDKQLKREIKNLQKEKFDKKQILKYFSNLNYRWQGKEIKQPEIYYFSNDKVEMTASRVNLDTSFGTKKIESITDTGIQKILKNHLSKFDENVNGTIIEHPELAFSPEGIEEMNKNIRELNDGKPHKPIIKIRTYEPKGNKFNVGTKGNKKLKFVEADKGTNLFFAVYIDDDGKRNFETIPLNIIIERLKQGYEAVPEKNEKGHRLLFHLSPNDLVYLPTEEEIINRNISIPLDKNRIYKMVSCTGNESHFIPFYIANPIVKTTELGSNNKAQRAWTGEMIKEICIPIKVDRLGNIVEIKTT